MFETVPIGVPGDLDEVAAHDLAGVGEHRAHLVGAAAGEQDDADGDQRDGDRRHGGDPADHS